MAGLNTRHKIVAHPFAVTGVMLSVTHISNALPHVIALAIAYLLAVPIGWNREREERSAGLRTFPLVAMASCGFVQAVETMMAHDPAAIARVLEGVIAGIGFLGGGAILQHKQSVKGTATAASLWATGAIGVASGLGSYDVAIVLMLFVLLTFWIMAPLKPETNERTDEPVDEVAGP